MREVFDGTQMSAVRLAIDLILEDLSEDKKYSRKKVANAVFSVAAETGEFDPNRLAEKAKERLASAVR